MKITALTFARSAKRPLCVATIHVADGVKTHAAQRAADMRRRKKIPVDQCGEVATHMVDEQTICFRHASSAALAHVMSNSAPPRTNEEEAAKPRCGCAPEVARRVIVDHGVCGMGGCPYGGDV